MSPRRAKAPKQPGAAEKKAGEHRSPKTSSLVFRLNTSLFFRQVRVFVCMDLLLVLLCVAGLFLWGESRCAAVAALVEERGVPTQDAIPWMQASDYTITPLDRAPSGAAWRLSWLPLPEETADGLRRWDLSTFYTVELPNGGEPYAITVDLSGICRILRWAALILGACQLLSLVNSLFRNNRSIRKTLRPIQELAATAARLNSLTHLSRQELQTLAGQLNEINATHLDARIDLPSTQKELQTLAASINSMLDRINGAYRAQMDFVSNASHELRTPIAVIQGYAALLDRWGKNDPKALQESISAIRTEADAMQQLVEQLLFLARSDNDSQPMQPELFDLTLLAGEVVREEEMIHPSRPFLPRWSGEVKVLADPALIKQALRILVDNAVNYSGGDAPITLRVDRAGGEIRLSVQDEGQGIPPQALPHIFERFYRTDESRARRTGGTGLGLAIARWIVERHGGYFEVLSREGIGSRFTMVLPAPQG